MEYQGNARASFTLAHGGHTYREYRGQRWESQGVAKTEGERPEKEEQLTTRSLACSGKPEEDRSGRISPD
jgi:hypothetical protein